MNCQISAKVCNFSELLTQKMSFVNDILLITYKTPRTCALFPFFYFVNTLPMERINKATLLGYLLFSGRKGRNLLKPLAAWC